jgi:hypothetical protein
MGRPHVTRAAGVAGVSAAFVDGGTFGTFVFAGAVRARFWKMERSLASIHTAAPRVRVENVILLQTETLDAPVTTTANQYPERNQISPSFTPS